MVYVHLHIWCKAGRNSFLMLLIPSSIQLFIRAGAKRRIDGTSGARAATSCARGAAPRRGAAARRACARCRVRWTCAERSCFRAGASPLLSPGTREYYMLVIKRLGNEIFYPRVFSFHLESRGYIGIRRIDSPHCHQFVHPGCSSRGNWQKQIPCFCTFASKKDLYRVKSRDWPQKIPSGVPLFLSVLMSQLVVYCSQWLTNYVLTLLSRYELYRGGTHKEAKSLG
jgi:hypothetical protein